ncbi:MAG TPA: cyclase family protein [Fluviicola sp.]|nr:cyclase family protein [Fluviicola sp.]
MQLFLEDGSYILTNEGIDCSIPLQASPENPRAWYVDAPVIEPVRTDQWTGSVAEGGSVNFRNIFFNPHGHGTHTECLGHITPEVYSVNDVRIEPFMKAQLISITPENRTLPDGTVDSVVTASQVADALQSTETEALLIRTLPNDPKKRSTNYSSTNPTYFDAAIVDLLDKAGVKHLLVDVPSVDREQDNGALVFHHAFWGVPHNQRFDRTITELIYIDDAAEDGLYLLSIETAPFVNDATPSRPVIYPVHRNAEDQ